MLPGSGLLICLHHRSLQTSCLRCSLAPSLTSVDAGCHGEYEYRLPVPKSQVEETPAPVMTLYQRMQTGHQVVPKTKSRTIIMFLDVLLERNFKIRMLPEHVIMSGSRWKSSSKPGSQGLDQDVWLCKDFPGAFLLVDCWHLHYLSQSQVSKNGKSMQKPPILRHQN